MTTAALLYAFAAALTAAMLYVILRSFTRYNIYNLHALTANYVVASATSLFSGGDVPHMEGNTITEFIVPGFLIGSLFISVFYTVAIATQRCGVAITSIAGKMSMVIPIAFAVLLWDDSLTVLKIAGIILALAAVYLSGSSSGDDTNVKSKNWYLPLLVFIGSGLVDTSIKVAQHYFINESNHRFYISMIFASAGCIGLIASIYNYIRKKIPVSIQSIAGGSILGVVNYYSLYFLYECLALRGVESSLVFSVVNLLVVILSAIFAFTLFKEKPERKKIAGLSLALFAIIILYL
jgi:drug/metabolite transporter (DMT)-like permease